ncbi:MAG: heme-binding protein, partial [Phycisphaerae bacterium]|nr:heme-binding protein [Phycisphaerae bacterium]
TATKEGTLPTALKFHQAPFKNGSDPYRMYQTLERGFGLMVPQVQYTAAQKYDVIHYIRETLVKPNNPGQYASVDQAYLRTLPRKSTRIKEQPTVVDRSGPQFAKMNFGPALTWTYQVAAGNIAYKAIAVRLDDGPGGVSRGRAWMIYDHDTMRVAVAYSGDRFVDWRGIAFDGSHGTHTSIVGDKAFVNPVGPGWADPATGSWEDNRLRGRDGKPYGPLARAQVHYRGIYTHGNRTVIAYTVGDAAVLEMPGWIEYGTTPIYTRTLNIGKSSRDLALRVAPASDGLAVAVSGAPNLFVTSEDGFFQLRIPAAATPARLKLLISPTRDPTTLQALGTKGDPAPDLAPFTRGGPPRWNQPVTTRGHQGKDDGPFAVDILTAPNAAANPWESWMRLGGFDFFPDGNRAAVCTWMGDVWIVEGIDGELGELKWKRIATGLFQPLGLKIVKGKIYVACRDQIARLHDLNGDQEIDFIESFNNDHQVTEHFHEFAMGLQTDDQGNFYYAKSARHALKAVVPHHGTLLRVSPDGSKTDIVATGFRAANGVCLNPDGTWIVTDQEGHWNPKNRINYVKEGGFYGNMYGYHDVTDSSDSAMQQPLCWITNAFDRSPSELLWVPKSAKWGPLNGVLLNLSYGYGKIYTVPHEIVGGQAQGGMCQLPLPQFPTGVMRGRFHPKNGQLYGVGMFAWGGNQKRAGGFYRVRYTGKPALVPVGLKALASGLQITFSDPLDARAMADAEKFRVKTWALKRTKGYGSKHHDTKQLPVRSAHLSADGRTMSLEIPGIQPTWCMEIACQITGADGQTVQRVIHNTIHKLP